MYWGLKLVIVWNSIDIAQFAWDVPLPNLLLVELTTPFCSLEQDDGDSKQQLVKRLKTDQLPPRSWENSTIFVVQNKRMHSK